MCHRMLKRCFCLQSTVCTDQSPSAQRDPEETLHGVSSCEKTHINILSNLFFSTMIMLVDSSEEYLVCKTERNFFIIIAPSLYTIFTTHRSGIIQKLTKFYHCNYTAIQTEIIWKLYIHVIVERRFTL